VDKRHFLAPMAIELDAWLKTTPEAPDLEKRRKAGTNLSARFTICGEGECINASGRYSRSTRPAKPRRGSIDLDKWGK
jgi:hypothetical protein